MASNNTTTTTNFAIDTNEVHSICWTLKNGDTSVSRVKTNGEALLVNDEVKILFYNVNSGVEYSLTMQEFIDRQPTDLGSVADSKGRITSDSIAKATK